MNFERIVNNHPSERAAITRLKQLIEARSGQRKEYTLNYLCDLVQPENRHELAMALGELIRAGAMKQVVRVISPKTHGAIKDFKSLDEVPEVIHDWRSDTEIEVRPDDLEVVYIVPGK